MPEVYKYMMFLRFYIFQHFSFNIYIFTLMPEVYKYVLINKVLYFPILFF